MPNFILAYHEERQFDTPEQGAEQQIAWGAWLHGLGDAVVSPGQPLGPSQVVRQGGAVEPLSGPAALMGYTIVEAETIEEAIDMAKACPFLEIGSIEVAQCYSMPGGG